MREKRMTALWQPYEWHVGCGLHLEAIYPIPSGVVVWVQIPQGRYLVQAALKQGRRYKVKQEGGSR